MEEIGALNNNLAAALKAERLNILAPVPGKSSVGVEVPNPVKTSVIMRDLLESEEWRNTKARIPLALGKDVYGHPIISDLSEMPHVLDAPEPGSAVRDILSQAARGKGWKRVGHEADFEVVAPSWNSGESQVPAARTHEIYRSAFDGAELVLGHRSPTRRHDR